MDNPTVIFQDDNLLVINKPDGWVVNNSLSAGQTTIENWLSENFQFSIFNFQELRHGIVHRLDKPTSGVLLVAKNEQLFHELQKQFFDRKVHKTYLALTHGEIKEKEGVISAKVGRLPKRRDRFGIIDDGREAETEYKVLNILNNGEEKYSLVELHPKTGRTHQLRIHLKYINHPIVGDSFYAGRKTYKKDLKWCPRLFLHAEAIDLEYKGKKLHFEAPLPEELQKVLATLRSSRSSD